jgi:4-hydroxybenzoate polyprenyltransferase
VWSFIILPAFKAEYYITGEFPKHLSRIDFTLLVISTLMIAAAGYIINDFFDRSIDEVNKPGKNIIDKKVRGKSAKRIFYVLSLIGIAIGFYLAWRISKPVMGFIHIFSAISLWMYSSYYKRRLFIGNVIVSLLCFLSIVIVALFEPSFYANINFIFWFAIPAFLLSMTREMIKDIEDLDGDKLAQCKTAPIILGIRKTKMVIQFIIILTTAYILYILYKNFYTNVVLNFWYLSCLFMIPLAALSYMVFNSSEKKDFYYSSLFTKMIMLCGVLSIIPFWYYFLK